MAGQQRDAIDVLQQDHREVEQMFAELESLRGASTEEAKSRRKDLTEQVTIELVRHSVAEEVLVHPQVEAKVGAEEAEHAREEHAEAEESMHRLEKRDADDPPSTTSSPRSSLRSGTDELRTRGDRVEACKQVAPTRPHPNVPNEPLPRLAAGPAASLFDRMRDLATGRGAGD